MARGCYVGANAVKLTNLLTNGSLASDTSGWTIDTTNYTLTQYSGYIRLQAKNTNSGKATSIYATNDCIDDDSNMFYVSAVIQVPSSNTGTVTFYLGSTVGGSGLGQGAIKDGTWHRISYRYASATGLKKFWIQENNRTQNQRFFVKECMVINLTKAFGAGNEPSQDWCDNNIPFFDETITLPVSSSIAPSTARKVKKIYVGVDGIARKIKRAYVGVNGVARLWWNGGELAYWGTATALSAKRWDLSGGSVGNYAVFAGGYFSDSNVVDAYDQNLTRTIASTLSEAKHQIPTASIGNYIIFAGGHTSDGNSAVAKKKVDAYNTSLTKTTKTDLSSSVDGKLSGVTIGNYAFLASGTVAVYYNSSLTRYNGTALSSNRLGIAAATVGNYALYAGGGAMQYGGWYQGEKTVDAYNTSLTRSSAPDLQTGRAEMARATICNTYCLFGGGGVSSLNYEYVDAYNASLTRTTATDLTCGRNRAGGGIGDYAVFAGGGTSSHDPIDTVESYDLNLTKTSITSLSTARMDLAAANINDVYLLFAGGRTGGSSSSSSASNIVDVYMV